MRMRAMTSASRTAAIPLQELRLAVGLQLAVPAARPDVQQVVAAV